MLQNQKLRINILGFIRHMSFHESENNYRLKTEIKGTIE